MRVVMGGGMVVGVGYNWLEGLVSAPGHKKHYTFYLLTCFGYNKEWYQKM